MYSDRWWILFIITLLHFANYGHWVSFGAITKSAAKYYDKPGNKIDLITVVSFGIGTPCAIIATYTVETLGLKFNLKLAGISTGIGKKISFSIICIEFLI